MHARLHELLSLRDGEPVEAAVRTHVAGCAECAAALAGTRSLREHLRSLPPVPPATADGWGAVAARLAARRRRGDATRRIARLAAAASVAVLALFAALRWQEPAAPGATAAAPSATPARVTLEELRSRSQALEAALAAMPARPAVARAGTAVPIESLEAQVQWLDHQLLLADAGEPAEDAERLWHDRVEVMSSLVQLRYVEAQQLNP
ncbi:MAG: hypothetical protein MUF60_08910 [Vicinamibacterales bacterium]|jgi:hypothetical protein|nr:hypothetical protein [Vicinamibacterales bacterium]